MKKKIIVLSAIVIIVIVGGYLYKTLSIPDGGKIYGNGAYRAIPVDVSFNGLCGEELIVDALANKRITTINLCEDNIKSIEKVDDNLVIITDRKNPFYIKNLLTGEVIDIELTGGPF